MFGHMVFLMPVTTSEPFVFINQEEYLHIVNCFVCWTRGYPNRFVWSWRSRIVCLRLRCCSPASVFQARPVLHIRKLCFQPRVRLRGTLLYAVHFCLSTIYRRDGEQRHRRLFIFCNPINLDLWYNSNFKRVLPWNAVASFQLERMIVEYSKQLCFHHWPSLS
ncbi:hypothetical protein BC830DRAFT_951110 [Chytriomyces sp. MP71]|nr:hypothetical protein BC830DRAFT_951110 [Chytriomyces sp. MP71]